MQLLRTIWPHPLDANARRVGALEKAEVVDMVVLREIPARGQRLAIPAAERDAALAQVEEIAGAHHARPSH